MQAARQSRSLSERKDAIKIGKKILFFLYGLTPTLAWLAVQIILGAGYGIALLFLQRPAEIFPPAAQILELLNDQGIYLLSIMANIIFLVFGIFWLRAVSKKEGWNWDRRMSPAGWGYGICVGIAVQAVSGYFLMMAAVLVPEAMEEYAQLVESMGIGAPTLLSLLYIVVAAPVAEELIYRGLTLRIFEKAFPFWTANVMQAALFGLMHMNLIQSTYAFLLGILLGWMAKKYGTLKGSILCHFVINLSGNLIGYLPYPLLSRLLLFVLPIALLPRLGKKTLFK